MSHKTIISRNVTFDKNMFWLSTMNSPPPSNHDFLDSNNTPFLIPDSIYSYKNTTTQNNSAHTQNANPLATPNLSPNFTATNLTSKHMSSPNLSFPHHKLLTKSAHRCTHVPHHKWAHENNMEFLSLANFLIFIHYLHNQFLCFLPISFMHYMIIIGKWQWKMNMILLLKIRRVT